MKLSEVNQALDHRITGGSDYQWNCFGSDARFLDYESEYAHVSIVFDSAIGCIYVAEVNPENDTTIAYRWINPAYKNEYLAEHVSRKIDPDIAWDDIKYTNLEVEEDWLEKARAIFLGESFDNRIQVPLNLDDDLLLQLAMEAHKRDITLNQMVCVILQEVIDNGVTEPKSV